MKNKTIPHITDILSINSAERIFLGLTFNTKLLKMNRESRPKLNGARCYIVYAPTDNQSSLDTSAGTAPEITRKVNGISEFEGM